MHFYPILSNKLSYVWLAIWIANQTRHSALNDWESGNPALVPGGFPNFPLLTAHTVCLIFSLKMKIVISLWSWDGLHPNEVLCIHILCCRWPKEEERSCHFLFGNTIFLSKTLVKDGCFDKSGFSKIDFCCINAILLTAHAATPLWSFFCTCTVLCRFKIV